MTNPNHGTITTTVTYYDGQPIKTGQELSQSLFTDKQSLLKDIIDALSVISSGATTKLTVEIRLDKKGRMQLVKKWAVD